MEIWFLEVLYFNFDPKCQLRYSTYGLVMHTIKKSVTNAIAMSLRLSKYN